MRTLTAVAARVVGATKVYGSGHTAVRALDGVSVELREGSLYYSAAYAPKRPGCESHPDRSAVAGVSPRPGQCQYLAVAHQLSRAGLL